MGVYIEGMEMPKNCGRCFLRVGQCSKRIYMENRPLDCPIIEVPKSHNLEAHEPHGRLVDADALLNKLQALYDERSDEARYTGSREIKVSWNDAVYQIICAPTIIQKDVTDTNDGNIPTEEGE